MKRLKFKNPLKGLDNAKKLIPEAYKVDGKEFEMTDGNETYRLKWESDLNEATVLTSSNKSQINEDMSKMKHLMGFKSQDTLGTVKGAARLDENNKFNDILGKSKSLITEGVLNEDNPPHDKSEEEQLKYWEDKLEELKEAEQYYMGHHGPDERMLKSYKQIYANIKNLEGAIKTKEYHSMNEGSLTEEEKDVEALSAKMAASGPLKAAKKKINTRKEKLAAIEMSAEEFTDGDETLIHKAGRGLVNYDANEAEYEDKKEEEDKKPIDTSVTNNEGTKDRFDEIFD